MITIPREAATEITECVEDAIGHALDELRRDGVLISGETAWKIVSAFAEAKELEFAKADAL